MKKSSMIFFAAIAMLTVASCQKEELIPSESPIAKEGYVLATITRGDFCKTELNGTSVVWSEGDTILVTDGTKKVKVGIPDEFAGTNQATVKIDSALACTGKQLYAVYPFGAFASVSGDVVNVTIPNEQDGLFPSANIAVAKMTKDYKFALKNVTSVFKVDVAENIQTLAIAGGAADTLAAAVAVHFPTDTTKLSVVKTKPVKSIRVALGGLPGTYYVAVAPGTYSDKLSMTALTSDGKSEKVSSTKAHTLAIGDLADLGSIGSNPTGASFAGSGTEEDPYIIASSDDMTILANAVNNGVDYAGVFFKVSDNISGVETPVGTYDGADFYFKGNFDGGNKTITLAMGGEESAASYLALFGELGAGANIKNVTIAGTVSTTGSCVAGIAGVVNGGTDGVTITDCSNGAVISGKNQLGGIVGYCDGKLDIINCSNTATVTATANYAGGIIGFSTGASINVKNCNNSGAVSGTYDVAGITGHQVQGTIDNCSNTSSITATALCDGVYKLNQGKSGWMWHNWAGAWAGGTPFNQSNSIRGVGGIAGYAQNGTVKECSNSGAINGVNKVGGIIGAAYCEAVGKNTNTAAITGTETMVGGICGYIFTNATLDSNHNSGAITAKAMVGGSCGYMNCLGYSSSNATITIKNDINDGAITATTPYRFVNGGIHQNYSCAGGIVGFCDPKGRTTGARGYSNITNCVNNAGVTGAGRGVGGIIGLYFGMQFSLVNNVTKCTNSGDVTGLTAVGGVVGDYYSLTTAHTKSNFSDLYNSGLVTSTASSADGKAYVGGIVGFDGASTYGNATYGMIGSNLCNVGDVVYNSADSLVYAGGVAGYANFGTFTNAYSVGAVRASDSSEPSEKTIGSVIGLFEGNLLSASYLYANDDILSGREFGTSSPDTKVSKCAVVSEGGILVPSVTVGETSYSSIYPALNAWVATQSGLYKWREGLSGPEFDK